MGCDIDLFVCFLQNLVYGRVHFSKFTKILVYVVIFQQTEKKTFWEIWLVWVGIWMGLFFFLWKLCGCHSILPRGTSPLVHPYPDQTWVTPPLGWTYVGCPGGPLECQGGYQARPKIHIIRVVFQDQALYARTSFRGAKTCKIGKKGVFLVI